MSDLRYCECEHVCHYESDWLSPCGNPGHRADTMFHLEAIRRVKTPYGVFSVCLDCTKDCHLEREILE